MEKRGSSEIIFSYDSLKAAIRFLEFRKRIELIKSVPSIRRICKLIPFFYQKVFISDPRNQDVFLIKLNDFKICILPEPSNIPVLPEEHDKIYRIPRENFEEWAQNFMNYFLERPGTVISNMECLELLRYFLPMTAMIVKCRVKADTVEFVRKGVMNRLRSCGSGELYVYGSKPERRIKFSQLAWRKLEISVDWCSVKTFFEYIENLLSGRYSVDSYYRTTLFSRVDYNRVLELVRRRDKNAEEKILSIGCCERDDYVIKLCITIKMSEELELNIWKGSHYTEAKIMPRGTAQFTREELKARQPKRCPRHKIFKFLRIPEIVKQVKNILEIVALLFMFVIFKIFNKNSPVVRKFVDE